MSEKIKTDFPGVRYREHKTRKHGLMKDRCFFIRHSACGKWIEESVGWASKDMTAKKANVILAGLQENHRIGKGPQTLREMREIENARREAVQLEKARKVKEEVTLADYFTTVYFPTAKLSKKKQTYDREETHFRLWMEKSIGNKPLKHIKSFDLERVKKNIIDSKKSPRTLQYVFATFRQVWNMARRDGIVTGDSPTRSVKLIRVDNKRKRYFTIDEEIALLEDLKKRSIQIYNITLLALRTGMRASEIFNLKWGCVDVENGRIIIMDGKGDKSRAAFMTNDIKAMFESMTAKGNDALVFPNPKGQPHKEIPNSFKNAVETLNLNEDCSDMRQRICFHSARHTFASRLAESGVDLYVIKELMGHSTILLTERYSHLSEGALQGAMRMLESAVQAQEQPVNGKVINLDDRR